MKLDGFSLQSGFWRSVHCKTGLIAASAIVMQPTGECWQGRAIHLARPCGIQDSPSDRSQPRFHVERAQVGLSRLIVRQLHAIGTHADRGKIYLYGRHSCGVDEGFFLNLHPHAEHAEGMLSPQRVTCGGHATCMSKLTPQESPPKCSVDEPELSMNSAMIH